MGREGGREEGPLCDPGSELLLGGRARDDSASIINGIKKEKNKTKQKNTVG